MVFIIRMFIVYKKETFRYIRNHFEETILGGTSRAKQSLTTVNL